MRTTVPMGVRTGATIRSNARTHSGTAPVSLLKHTLIEREGVEEFHKIDMAAYSKYTFSMFGGEITPVTMVFQNRMIGAVMDRFGREVLVMPEDKTHFRITVPVAVSQQFFGWVFGLGKAVRIVGPESVKEKMVKSLEDIAERNR